MPIGMNFGWGICGRSLTKELSELCHVTLLTDDFTMDETNDEKEFQRLNSLRNPADSDPVRLANQPMLQAIQGVDLKPWGGNLKNSRCIGYTFFEKNIIESSDVSIAQDYYDKIVAGSSWCEEILNVYGFSETCTIIQGIDQTLFYPKDNEKKQYKDEFVIFSGGKLELRKGQDLVLRVFKILQDKYPDVRLVNVWYNQWSQSIKPMAISPYIRFEMPKGEYFKAINHLLQVNGINPDKVTTLPPIPHNRMAEIYKNSDMGLFPNRCEGGTNLALMEYMACGKPAIASFSTGHRDILTTNNAIPLKTLQPFIVKDQDGREIYNWIEPTLDEIVSAVDWAYWHRDELTKIGEIAGNDLSKLTWKKSAKMFYEVIYD